MKSNSPKNPSSTSEEPEFNIGDLVCYLYRDFSDREPDIGLITAVVKVDIQLPEEAEFLDYFYEYDVLWARRGYTSIMFEMFIEKYEYEK